MKTCLFYKKPDFAAIKKMKTKTFCKAAVKISWSVNTGTTPVWYYSIQV